MGASNPRVEGLVYLVIRSVYFNFRKVGTEVLGACLTEHTAYGMVDRDYQQFGCPEPERRKRNCRSSQFLNRERQVFHCTHEDNRYFVWSVEQVPVLE